MKIEAHCAYYKYLFSIPCILPFNDMSCISAFSAMQNVDIATVDKSQLADVSGISFDNSLPQRERAARILAQVKNPYCFCHGDTAVKIEFSDDGPPLQDMIANFLIRQKSGL